MCKIYIRFSNGNGPAVRRPVSIYPATHSVDIYECIIANTDNYELAADVSGWADLASVGEVYYDRELYAEIFDD